jgi:hypothetical protein
MVSDAQTEGTFSIPLLEQARTALSGLSVIRVVGCLSYARAWQVEALPPPCVQILLGSGRHQICSLKLPKKNGFLLLPQTSLASLDFAKARHRDTQQRERHSIIGIFAFAARIDVSLSCEKMLSRR